VRTIIPPDQIETIVDNIGLSSSGINVVYNASGTIGSQDGDILISLKKGHSPTDEHIARLRRELPRLFPTATFSFLPADVTSQILNFGAPSPIDIQVTGNNLAANQAYAQRSCARSAESTGWPTRGSSSRLARRNCASTSTARASTPWAWTSATSPPAWPERWPAAPRRAGVLAQPGQRRVLSGRRPDPGIYDRQPAEAGRHPGDRRPAAGQEPQVLGGLGSLSRGSTPP
jgi:hypothetical protein